MEKKIENQAATTQDEMILAIKRQAGSYVQEFMDAQKKPEAIKQQKSDYTNRLESLKSEIKQPFEDENIEAAVKNRRRLQKEIEETEDILKNIETFFLDSQEKLHLAASNFTGTFLSVVNNSHTNHQKKMDQLFDTINLMNEDFSKAIIDVAHHFFGNGINNYIYAEQFATWRQIDFSHAPKDYSQFFAGAGAILRMKNK